MYLLMTEQSSHEYNILKGDDSLAESPIVFFLSCLTDQSSFLFLVGYSGIDDYPNTLSPWPT